MKPKYSLYSINFEQIVQEKKKEFEITKYIFSYGSLNSGRKYFCIQTDQHSIGLLI